MLQMTAGIIYAINIAGSQSSSVLIRILLLTDNIRMTRIVKTIIVTGQMIPDIVKFCINTCQYE